MTLRFISWGLLVFAAASAAAKPLPPVRAFAETEFRVCVVDEARKVESAAERAALRARIVASLQETVGVGWRTLCDAVVETKVAAKQMRSGECDAVIYFGEKRPRKLRRLDAVTFAVDLGPKHGFESVCVIVPAREVALQKTILAGWPKALAPLQPSTVLWAGR